MSWRLNKPTVSPCVVGLGFYKHAKYNSCIMIFQYDCDVVGQRWGFYHAF